MLHCFDHFRQEKNGLVAWQQVTNMKDAANAVEKAIEKAGEEEKDARKKLATLQEEVDKQENETKKKEKRRQITEKAREKLEAARKAIRNAHQKVPDTIQHQDVIDLHRRLGRVEDELQKLENDIDAIEVNRLQEPVLERLVESDPERVHELTEFNKNVSEAWGKPSGKEIIQAIDQSVAPILRKLDDELGQPSPDRAKVNRFIEQYRIAHVTFREKFAFQLPSLRLTTPVQTLNERGIAEMRADIESFFATLQNNRRISAGTTEVTNQIDDIARISLPDVEKEDHALRAVLTEYADPYNRPADQAKKLEELYQRFTTKTIGRIEMELIQHPTVENLRKYEGSLREWEKLGDRQPKWVADGMAKAYRDVLYRKLIEPGYGLTRPAANAGISVRSNPNKAADTKVLPQNEVEAFLQREGVSATPATNQVALAFYLDRDRTLPRSEREREMMKAHLAATDQPPHLRSDMRNLFNRPIDTLLGSPLLFIAFLAGVIFDKKHRDKYIGAFIGLSIWQAAGGAEGAGDAGKALLAALDDTFKDTKMPQWLRDWWEQKKQEWFNAKPASGALAAKVTPQEREKINISEAKSDALVGWLGGRTVKDVREKGEDELWTELETMRKLTGDALTEAKKKVGGTWDTLLQVTRAELTAFWGAVPVKKALEPSNDTKTFRSALDAVPSSRVPTPEEQRARTESQNQQTLKDLQLEGSEFTLGTDVTKAANGYATRTVEYLKAGETQKRTLTINYDGRFYKVEEGDGVKFRLWYDSEKVLKSGLKAHLDRTNNEWTGPVQQFAQGTDFPPEWRKTDETELFYSTDSAGKGSLNYIIRNNEGVFAKVGIRLENTTEQGEGGEPLKQHSIDLMQVADAKGTPLPSGTKNNQTNFDDWAQFKAGNGMDGWGKMQQVDETTSGAFFANVGKGDRFTEVATWDSEGAEDLNKLFDYEGRRYKAYRSVNGYHDGSFVVEEVTVDQDNPTNAGAVGNGYLMFFPNEAEFTQHFPRTVEMWKTKKSVKTMSDALRTMPKERWKTANFEFPQGNDGYINLHLITTQNVALKAYCKIGEEKFGVVKIDGGTETGIGENLTTLDPDQSGQSDAYRRAFGSPAPAAAAGGGSGKEIVGDPILETDKQDFAYITSRELVILIPANVYSSCIVAPTPIKKGGAFFTTFEYKGKKYTTSIQTGTRAPIKVYEVTDPGSLETYQGTGLNVAFSDKSVLITNINETILNQERFDAITVTGVWVKISQGKANYIYCKPDSNKEEMYAKNNGVLATLSPTQRARKVDGYWQWQAPTGRVNIPPVISVTDLSATR